MVNSAMWIYIFGKLVLTLSGVLCSKPTNTMRSGSQARKADDENNPAQINFIQLVLCFWPLCVCFIYVYIFYKAQAR
jgi:hypothetical protein